MNNLRELTNREYLSGGTEIRGRGQGHVENEAPPDTSSCKMCDGIYVLFIRIAMRIEGDTDLVVFRE